jgi:hypothetical protein
MECTICDVTSLARYIASKELPPKVTIRKLSKIQPIRSSFKILQASSRSGG